MINHLLNYISDAPRTALTSLIGAAVGQAAAEGSDVFINTMLQRGAWTVAILAGLLTMINLFFPLRSFYDKKKRRELDKTDTQ